MRPPSSLLAVAVTLAVIAACGTDGASDSPGSVAPDAGGGGTTPPPTDRPDGAVAPDASSAPDAATDAGTDAGGDAATATYTIGGSITGLTAAGLVLRNNGGDDLTVPSGATSFVFATPVSSGATYDVKVHAQPAGLSCAVIDGSGTATSAVSNVTVSCVPVASNTWSIGGSIAGLSGAGLTLKNNGADTIAPAAGAKSFTFPTRIANNASYAVTVATQPSSPTQTCSVTSGGSGTATADVSNVVVTCATDSFALGGTVSGLAPGAAVTLQNNGGGDLVVSANGAFTFGAVPSGSTYLVTVKTQPADHVCTASQNSGTIGAAPVSTVTITCATAVGFARSPVGAGLGNASVAGGTFPALLSQTGAFTNLANLTPHASFVPFKPNAQLWSDAAIKTRWVSVPNDGAPYTASERVTFSDVGLWTFPTGTMTMKHFELVVNEVTGARKRLETRLGVLLSNGTFAGATYRWRADGSDADLVTTTTNEVITITTAGGTRNQTHTYPAATACTECHRTTSGFALGLRTAQLNGDYAYPGGITQNQLRAWGHAEMFTGTYAEASIATYLRTVAIDDATASLEARSRSYLEANCSSCHHPGGPNQGFDARFSTPLAQQNLIGQEVKPGDHASSKLWKRMSYAAVDTPQNTGQMMPPLAKNHVDTYALDVVAQWIDAL